MRAGCGDVYCRPLFPAPAPLITRPFLEQEGHDRILSERHGGSLPTSATGKVPKTGTKLSPLELPSSNSATDTEAPGFGAGDDPNPDAN